MIDKVNKIKEKRGVQMHVLQSIMRSTPCLNITSKDLPEIKEWDLGKEYKISLVVKMIGIKMMNKEIESEYMGKSKISKDEMEGQMEVIPDSIKVINNGAK